MANWNVLKSAIANAIKTNDNKEITGQVLQNVLNNVVSSVGENATFAGIAIPSTTPGVPDGPVFYIASTPGVYSNFGGLVVNPDEASIFVNSNSSWKKTFSFSAISVNSKINIGLIPSLLMLPNIDTVNKVLDLGDDPVLVIANRYYGLKSLIPDASLYRAIPIYDKDNLSGAIILLFNIHTYEFKAVTNHNFIEQEGDVAIGFIRTTYISHVFKWANFPFEYTIDGKAPPRVSLSEIVVNYATPASERRYSYYIPIPRKYIKTIRLSVSEGYNIALVGFKTKINPGNVALVNLEYDTGWRTSILSDVENITSDIKWLLINIRKTNNANVAIGEIANAITEINFEFTARGKDQILLESAANINK